MNKLETNEKIEYSSKETECIKENQMGVTELKNTITKKNPKNKKLPQWAQ